MENRLKSLLGASAETYLAIKLQWLLRRYPDLRGAGPSFQILDYGCGAATMLRLIAEAGVQARLAGCDVAGEMLAEAERRWPAGLQRPSFCLQEGSRAPLPTQFADLVMISAVLHHVLPSDRPGVYAELRRLLRPGGRVVVFEHNPLNPLTRYVVATTPIDRNAILLRAREVVDALGRAGFTDIRTSYLMFLPPRLHRLAAIERALEWLPLGAQFAVTARAPVSEMAPAAGLQP